MRTLTRLLMVIVFSFCLLATATQAVGELHFTDDYFATRAELVAFNQKLIVDESTVQVNRDMGITVTMKVREANKGTIARGLDLTEKWISGSVYFLSNGQMLGHVVVLDPAELKEIIRNAPVK